MIITLIGSIHLVNIEFIFGCTCDVSKFIWALLSEAGW